MLKTTVHIRKESIKFSAAHMTVFPDGSKEALHGHNYQVELSLELKNDSFEKTVPFSNFKEKLKDIVRVWDEKFLLALKNPFYQEINKDKKEIEFILCKKRYVLPVQEVEFLPIENISSESLSEHLLSLFIKSYGQKELKKVVNWLRVRVDESPGQGASSETSLQ